MPNQPSSNFGSHSSPLLRTGDATPSSRLSNPPTGGIETPRVRRAPIRIRTLAIGGALLGLALAFLASGFLRPALGNPRASHRANRETLIEPPSHSALTTRLDHETPRALAPTDPRVRTERFTSDDLILRAEQLARAEPERSREFAYAAIAGLHDSNRSPDAAAFALQSILGPRRDLVIAAYFEWSQRDSETAVLSALQITASADRETALQAAFSGWAKRDPIALAEFALRLPGGHEQNTALTKALRYWSLRDPEAAARWIATHDAIALPAVELALRVD